MSAQSNSANPPPYSPEQPGYPPQQPGYQPQQPGYPPQQLGYPPQQLGYPQTQPGQLGPQQQPQVILQQPGRTAITMHPNMGLSPNSFNTTCPACRNNVQTVRTQEYGPRTHMCALVLCLFCCLPCVPIPYCIDSCKDIKHHCPECQAFIGTYYNHV